MSTGFCCCCSNRFTLGSPPTQEANTSSPPGWRHVSHFWERESQPKSTHLAGLHLGGWIQLRFFWENWWWIAFFSRKRCSFSSRMNKQNWLAFFSRPLLKNIQRSNWEWFLQFFGVQKQKITANPQASLTLASLLASVARVMKIFSVQRAR